MPWVTFERVFVWTPVPVQSTVYKPGMTCLVTTPCANKAIKEGAAKKVKRPDGARKESRQTE